MDFWKEILDIEGNTIYLEKKAGTWAYRLTDTDSATISVLHKRKQEGWNVLGAAAFVSKGNLAILKKIYL